MIFINKVFLDDKNFSKNLIGDLLIKNNKVNSLKLTSDFENNGKFKIEVKTLKNKKKTTAFYSDNAEPFVKHYKFIKGFKEGKIDFYSVKENNVSNSTLNIFDFKVKEKSLDLIPKIKDNFKRNMSLVISRLNGSSMHIKNRFGNC